MLTLHIGRRKTGTTSLQMFMAKNAARLERLGIIYPLAGRLGRSHHLLARASKNFDLLSAESAEAWRELRKAMRNQPDKHFVISSEALESATPRKVLKACGTDAVSVICYLRPTHSHVLSAYNQRSKLGIGTLDFDAHFMECVERTGLNYAPRLLAWSNLVGPDRVRVRMLTQGCLAGGTLYSDFLDALGVDTNRQSRLSMTETANSSPKWELIELLRDFYASLAAGGTENLEQSIPEVGRHAFRTVESLKLESTPVEYFTPAQYAYCLQAQARDTLELKQAGLDVHLPSVDLNASIGERPFLPGIEAVAPDLQMAFYRELASALGGQRGSRDSVQEYKALCLQLATVLKPPKRPNRKSQGPRGHEARRSGRPH